MSLEKGMIAPLGIVAIKQIETENKVQTLNTTVCLSKTLETTLFHHTPLGKSSSKRQEKRRGIPRFSDCPRDAPLGFLDQKSDITIVFGNSTCLDEELH